MTKQERQHKTRRAKKLKLIRYKGGCCVKCGYKKCAASLSFHHKDPKKKRFELHGGNLSRNIDELLKEVKKCSLLCHNCHAELHYNE